jgi:hypothetical protein
MVLIALTTGSSIEKERRRGELRGTAGALVTLAVGEEEATAEALAVGRDPPSELRTDGKLDAGDDTLILSLFSGCGNWEVANNL